MVRKSSFLPVLLFVICSASFAVFTDDDWCGFRGLEREGRSDSQAAPIEWSSSKNVLWKTTIPGRGHSSPIVCGDKVEIVSESSWDKYCHV